MMDNKVEEQSAERKLKILITDDSKMLRRKLRADLEGLGCEVVESTNGKDAVMMFLKDEFDGVILDIVMPEVGGIEALQLMKEVKPDIPIVMLSSSGTPQKLMQTLKMGALDFIQKPYMRDQIVKVIDAVKREKIKRDQKKSDEEAAKK